MTPDAGEARALVVEADGGSRGNPGVAGWGALVRDAGTGEVLVELAAPIGVATNNVAEYSGLLAALGEVADRWPGARVTVRMDSKLVVEQMAGNWKVKHEDMRRLHARVTEVARAITRAGGSITYEWVPREQNTAADALSNAGMDGHTVRRAGGGAEEVAAPAPAFRLVLLQSWPEPTGMAPVGRAVASLLGAAAPVVTGPEPTPVAETTAGCLGSRVEPFAETDPAALARHAVSRAQEGGDLVLVTDRDVVVAALAQVLGVPVPTAARLRTDDGSMTLVEREEGGDVRVAFTNRTDHLA